MEERNMAQSSWSIGLARWFVLALLVFSGSFGSALAQSFSHPGILHTQADFARMTQRVNASEEPYISSYNLLVSSPEAQLSWTPRATATVVRGGAGDNVALLYRDVQAAYQHALIYKITGNTAHGNKARDILNAWSSTHTVLTGNADRYLASGLFGYQFANAAEMMRGYSGFNVGAFQNYLLNVYYYPLVERFLVGNSHGSDHNDACITNYWANWDLANMAAMIAIGVFTDNRGIYNRGIEYFKNGAGNGSIRHAVPFVHSSTLGQWQESGRDQGHSILGVGLMASFAEIAWNQGDDMYGYDDSRFRKGAEYVARYNVGQSVPYTLYSWGSGQNCAYNEQPGISAAGRGELRPIWEMIYNHYANRVGQASLVPSIAAQAQRMRPEGGPGGHATTYDQPGFGSLTHYGEGGSGPVPAGVRWESYNFPNYFIRHQNNVGRIDQNVSPVADGRWNMVSGLADASGVSFESVNFPGQYLRHYDYQLTLGTASNSTQRADATFYRRSGLANGSWLSFESYNFPGYYIRHANYVLRIDQISGSAAQQDATFREIGN
jgi:hypothetical protein